MTAAAAGAAPPELAVGVDVSSGERIRLLVERRPEFTSKYFSEEEAEYCRGRPERLAARWAAKEAVRKLYGGLGLPIPLYSQIAVSKRPGGAPQILVSGEPVSGLSLSLTHDAGLGLAVAAVDRHHALGTLGLSTLPAELELPERPPDGHKGTFGTVVVIAGSPDFPGAAVLCSVGALRGGAGKVKALVGAESSALPPEVIRVPVEAQAGRLGSAALAQARPDLDHVQAVVCGPGLGESQATEELLDELFATAAGGSFHLVLDADALNVCATRRDLLGRIPQGSVVTPHPLEASRLARMDVAAVQSDREGTARRLARELQAVVVLKGAHTLVAAADGALYQDRHATSALASGGTGDVLAGLVGAQLAQGLSPFAAARAAVFLHGAAGEQLARTRGRAGILASEVAEALVEVQEWVRRALERQARG